MTLSTQALEVLNRPLPKDKIRKRPGKAGMEFSYITPDFVIQTLNEAFNSAWSTHIVSSAIHEGVAVVGLELEVPDENGGSVRKQQFGACEITRGLDAGAAFKGAASDALKKCATLLGLGLELYQDDEAPGGPSTPPKFKPPQGVSRPSGPSKPAPSPAPRPAAPAPPARPSGPPASPKAPPKPPAPPTKSNPFAKSGANTTQASVPRPAAPSAPPAPAPPRDNPFASKAEAASGPSSTQVNALTNLASRKGIAPADLIASVGITDAAGNPVQHFEELTRDQAIQVIKASHQQ